jgi:hypothetical protein
MHKTPKREREREGGGRRERPLGRYRLDEG